ncbi:hypothetical protein SCLARK_001712 [Spiroplasma clarkii]|nr:hypothetical protein SCLARK_001712 [Spiroplasma clarkii]
MALKKILGLLASFGLVTSSVSTAVACNGTETALKYGDLGVLADKLAIDETQLKDFKTAKALYDAILVKIENLNSITLVNTTEESSVIKQTLLNAKQIFEQTSYSITLSNGANEKVDNDFGKKGDRRFIKVTYIKQFVQGILNSTGDDFTGDKEVISTIESDFASFAIVNQE